MAIVRPHRSVLALTVAAALLAAAGGCRGGAAPRNVLVVTLDTLRADHVGAYGYAAARTPTLDALAARGARFANATTTTPLTLSAHSSLFTGLFPTAHGIRDNTGFHVDDQLTTLAEVFKGRGYRTGGFVGAFVLDARWGIAQGFDHYVDDFDLSEDVGPGLDVIQRRGGEVVDRAAAWLGDASTQPFCARVHLYDPHTPYDAPAEFAGRFPATRDGAYDAGIAYTDAQLGRLLDGLRASGRLDDTLVVGLSDHGEQLGEHQEQSHGFFIYDASVQIPLIVAGPGVPARVVADQVRVVDVMPTILELTGSEAPGGMQGQSLAPALRGERQELLAFLESWYPRFHYGWSELQAVRDGRYKFILAPQRELYDLSTDAGETPNLASTDASRADRMERALRALVAQTTRTTAPATPAAVDLAVEQRLRALGYVGGASAKNMEARPRRDPKATVALYNLLLAGQDSELGRYDAAVAKVRQALAVDPEIIEGYSRLGNIHTKAGRHQDAIAAYRQALALDPQHLLSTYNLALAYRAAGRIDEAIVGFERVQALDPRSGRAHFPLGDICMQRGDASRALEVLTRGLARDVDRAPFLVKVAEAQRELKQFDAAETALSEALELRPTVPRGQYNLALVREQKGNTRGARAAFEAEVSANPKNYGAQFNLGKTLLTDGRHADAAARFRATVEARPEFKAGGFATAAFVSSFVLDSSAGLSRGFDHYDDAVDTAEGERAVSISSAQRRGDETLTRAEQWLDARTAEVRAQRTALWIHLYDPHDPYEPPEPFATRFAAQPYDGEVAWTDTLLGRLRASLEARGLWNAALVLVTADHGESLGEHGEPGHGFFAYETTLKVPFVMRGPGVPAGTVRDGPLRLIDVAPTVAALLGVAPLAGATGHSLVSSLAAGAPPLTGTTYAEPLTPLVHYQWSDLRVLRDGSWKYILAPRPELYDLASDPGKTRDLATREPATARRLLQERRFAESAARFTELRRVGADSFQLHFYLGESLVGLGRHREAEARFARSAAIMPNFTQAHVHLADARIAQKNLPGALAALQQGQKDAANEPLLFEREGQVHQMLGDTTRALTAYRQAETLAPRDGLVKWRLGELLLVLGQPDQALAKFGETTTLAPQVADFWNSQGMVLGGAGRNDEAASAFRRAIERDAGNARYAYNLGLVLMRSGQGEAAAWFRKTLELDPRFRAARDRLAELSR